MNTANKPMYKWQDLPWAKIERAVFKLQKRIYQAAQKGDIKAVHRLQRLLINSWTARCLAVRRVTQDNQGKKTAGVDGIKSLNPEQRLRLAQTLKLTPKALPSRRVWIPKPGKKEKRPLNIPTIQTRAEQALAKLALEPEWEAHFETNSYGFRPGRGTHDAIDAIFKMICHKAKYVLDTDIEKCFDKINHQALLTKLQTFPLLRRTVRVRAWLKAGVIDQDRIFPTEQGAPQGGPISPLLMNVALHGLETHITNKYPQSKVCRYADDLVALHPEPEIIRQIQTEIDQWLNPMGLALKPGKTHITHTLKQHQGSIGFDFLGFHIRQYPAGKTHSAKSNQGKPLHFKTIIKPGKTAIKRHQYTLKSIVRQYRSSTQSQLIGRLNPVIKGWTAYYATVAAKDTFAKMDHLTFLKLKRWAIRKHHNKSIKWAMKKYWRLEQGHWIFSPLDGTPLYQYQQTPIKRHTKVRANKSPYDGDWLYWATRRGRQPETPKRIATLLKQQAAQCTLCGLYFKPDDNLQVDHIIPIADGGRDAYNNWQLIHSHCHHRKTTRENQIRNMSSTCDQSRITEERSEAKVSRSVLKPSGGGDPVA